MGIYTGRGIDTAKTTRRDHAVDVVTLHVVAKRRRLWLPTRYAPSVNGDEGDGVTR